LHEPLKDGRAEEMKSGKRKKEDGRWRIEDGRL
jgi:hypothetical protein